MSPTATAGKLADQWTGQGDKVVYHTIDDPGGTTTKPKDMKRVYKIVNENWDTVVWTPESPEIRAAKLKDPDTFTTQGGQQRTGNVDAARDPRGYYLDNEQKFLHAVETGDFRTVAKSASKAGEATGLHTRDPDFYDQAKALRKYADPVQAGVATLGDSPDVETRKMQDWSLEKAAPQMKAAEIEANRLAQSVDTQRQRLIEHARKNNNPELADAIEARRTSIVESPQDFES